MDDLLAAVGLSKRTIDRLGDALQRDDPTANELGAFNRYREAFSPALQQVVSALRSTYSGDVAERQKTIWSTVAKLRRETTRLTQVQDIAGCRIVVGGVLEQDDVTATLLATHAGWRLHDRRDNPSHGYRAVHIVARVGGLPVEVQVRTRLQHAWAELSESWDRIFDGVKYGRGPADVLDLLRGVSDLVAEFEQWHARRQHQVDPQRIDELRDMLLAAINQAWPKTSPE